MTTRREAVLNAIEAAFRNPGFTPGGGTTWGRVLASAPEGRTREAQHVLAVLEDLETYESLISPDKQDRNLNVELQSTSYIGRGVELRTGANEVLGDMEEVVGRNKTWNGTAIWTSLLSNTVNRMNTADRVVEVSLFIVVKYRSFSRDPRSV